MRRPVLLAVVALLAVITIVPVSALKRGETEIIPLPDGFRPEGITIGRGNTFYVGSIPTGAIYSGDLKTGKGGILVPGQDGRAAIGVAIDRKERLFVAGGGTGDGYVYDAETGAELAVYDFTSSANTFINDVVVTRDGAYFTDSRNAVLYFVPISPSGMLPPDAVAIPLTGDLSVVPGENNLNGIDATPSGHALFAVQSNTGFLFTIDPDTGVTDRIELENGETVPNGDGILFDGRTLWVIQNRLNLLAEVRLEGGYESGKVVSRTGNPEFDVPSTFDQSGNSFYFVNARFGTPTTPDTEYWITGIRKP